MLRPGLYVARRTNMIVTIPYVLIVNPAVHRFWRTLSIRFLLRAQTVIVM
jgi:hypothetical protein